ncbi:DHA2 family efflux MFS transporter permease subunit [Clostridium beijerinckii]|uniref:DHA2 family efflux MFS transporter permease subunit n=1 Tax=Clostridium beijerinckii TaxID=1520 RepID=UPI00156F7508|nr:DHA2 family efflux MFS transporter permease subunit [Clostridium beijerinckii]NRT70683.1 EmrB/QacA subfamily drug resistance transporter [Clostridium beijerinckii]
MKDNSNEQANPWLAMIVIIVGTFMSVLSSSIINVALTKMMSVFGVGLDDVKWVMTAYTLALGAIIPLTGYLQDIFGAKKVYIVALTIFTMGSALCGFAWSNSSMIAFRVFQAIGGGMMQPVGMSIIYSVFPRKKIGLALGVYGIAAMAAPAIGPTLGGLIIEKMDWRLIFTVNIPIGIIGVLLGMIILKGQPMKPFKAFDIVGFLSSTVGLVSLLYVLGKGSSIDWGDMINPMLVVLGSLSLILFVINELTHPDPLLDLRVLKLFDFSMSLVIITVLTIGLMGGSYVLPLFLQNVRGYTAMQAGLIMFPSALVMGALMPLSGTLYDKFGAKPVVIPGLIILALATFKLSTAINMNSSNESIIFINCIRSIGLGIAMMPISTAGMNVVKGEMIPRASALNSTIRQVASSLAVTIMTVIIQSKTSYNYSKLAEQINIYNKTAVGTINSLTKSYMYEGFPQETSKVMALSQLAKIIQGQASVDAMAYSISVTGAIAVVAIFLTLFMRTRR